MTVCVLTAVYDNYDELFDLPPQDVPVEAVCVTDNPALRSATWQIVHAPSTENGYRAAKHPKTCPWDYTDATHTIWIDASIRVTSGRFARDLTEHGPIAQFVHPWRDCIYDETVHSAHLDKYVHEPCREQALAYWAAGHPTHWGLWACGVIARTRCPETVEFGERWQAEIDRWSYQDQISHPFVLRELGLRPYDLPGSYQQGRNPWLRYEGSRRH